MPKLICPVSLETIDKRVSRVGAVTTAAALVAYAATGFWPILAVVVTDYLVRVFTPFRPPVSVPSSWLVKAVWPGGADLMNKGPKIFAWRVGFLMAAASLVLLPVSPTASIATAAALAGFNVLDGACNFCVGCAVYTYVVLPYLGPAGARAR